MHSEHEAIEKHRNPAVKWAFISFAVIVGLIFASRHIEHIAAYFPYIILAICPLMHLFHGHGGDRSGHRH
jgi:hypothetical protein